MKRENIISYETFEDVSEIVVCIVDADVEIMGTDSHKLTVQRLLHSRIRVNEHEGTIRIRQTGKPLFRRARVRIWIPGHCVPDVTLNIRKGTLYFGKSICGELTARCGEAATDFADCSFTGADVKAADIKFSANGLTVKTQMSLYAAAAEIIIENGLFTDLGINCKSGNLGLSSLKCADADLKTDKGSVNLILCGHENEYGISLTAKDGTCNRENSGGGEKTVKVYSGSGNIAVDFTEK